MEPNLPSVAIRGTGSCVPARIANNAEIAAQLEISEDWIRIRTGILERRIASVADTAATLGAAAARNALTAAGVSPTDIDLIVCATITPDLTCPSTACLIQAALGCRTIPAFDLGAACSGFVYALAVARGCLVSGIGQTALVVGADVLTRTLDYSDRNTCILFGDGGGAAVVALTREPAPRLHSVHLYADGQRQELIQVPSAVTPNPPPGPVALPQLKFLRMRGREVFKFAVQKMVELIQCAEEECRALGRQLDAIVPHQVNQRIIDSALEHTGFPAERVVVNLSKYGNTSAASVPIALDEAIRDGRCKPGDTVLLAAFGGGLTWSSALITL